MRIALVASSFLPRIGGVEEHVSLLARELRGRGHDVVVWSVDQGDVTPSDDDGTPLTYLPTPLPNRSVRGVLRWVLTAPLAWRSWRRAFRRDHPDVIVIQCHGPNGPYATALARRTRTPLVYANHGETFMDATGVFEASALQRRALRTTLATAAAVVSCSAFAAADLKRFGYDGRAAVVGNGIDLELAASPTSVSLPDRYIAGIGRLVANKGFDRLVRAYAAAAGRPELQGVSLVIAGSGDERTALEALADGLGVSDRVHLVGAQSRGEVRTILDGALAHVVPSDVEAFGIVVLEGWRSSTPVVATDRGGPAEFVVDGADGLLVDPHDVARLSELLVALVADPDLGARLGAAGRRSAERFSWAAVADSYERILDDVTTRADPTAPFREDVAG